MLLTKDGITIELFSPVEIRRYKKLGYQEVEAPKPAEQEEQAEPSAEEFAAEQQAVVEETLQPSKGKGKSKKG